MRPRWRVTVGLVVCATLGFPAGDAALAAAERTATPRPSTTRPAGRPTTRPTTRPTAPPVSQPKATTLTGSSWRVLAVSADGLAEVSGCAVSRRDPTRVWLHNDSGGAAVVVPVDLTTGAVGPAVTLRGVDAVDFEDIAATGDGTLVVADIGDNNERRTSVQLYRLDEPAIGATTADPTRFDVRYPDGPHDAEALVVAPDGASALIFTKDTSGTAKVFRADLTATSEQVLMPVGTVTISGEGFIQPNLITAADLLGSDIVLRSYWNGYLLKAPAGGTFEAAVHATPRRFDVPLMVQGEALCASADGKTLVSASESRGAKTFALAVGPAPR